MKIEGRVLSSRRFEGQNGNEDTVLFSVEGVPCVFQGNAFPVPKFGQVVSVEAVQVDGFRGAKQFAVMSMSTVPASAPPVK